MIQDKENILAKPLFTQKHVACGNLSQLEKWEKGKISRARIFDVKLSGPKIFSFHSFPCFSCDRSEKVLPPFRVKFKKKSKKASLVTRFQTKEIGNEKLNFRQQSSSWLLRVIKNLMSAKSLHRRPCHEIKNSAKDFAKVVPW